MAEIPSELQEILADFDFITNRAERTEYLIQLADEFDRVRVPDEVATQPYAEENHVQQCESDAYVWAEEQDDGTLQYYFDVLNPQGMSAMAMAVILEKALSGAPLEQIAAVSPDIVFKIFGKNVSMGKGTGLMGIVSLAQFQAKKRLEGEA